MYVRRPAREAEQAGCSRLSNFRIVAYIVFQKGSGAQKSKILYIYRRGRWKRLKVCFRTPEGAGVFSFPVGELPVSSPLRTFIRYIGYRKRKQNKIMPNDLLAKVMDAAVYAAVKHQYQRRAGYGQLPYMNHLLKVTEALIRVGEERDEALLLAAVLHDVLEDTDATHEELAQRFGREAADIVQELTDDMSIPYMERKWLQVEKASQLSEKARKIRIVDKITNIRDILTYPLDWPLEKKQNYLSNSIQVVARIRGGNPRLEAWFDETVEWAENRLKEMQKNVK